MNSILKSFHLSHKLLMSVLRLRRYDPILNELLMDFSKKLVKGKAKHIGHFEMPNSSRLKGQ